MSDRVLVNVEGGVADVRLNRADKMNAIDPAMFEGIAAAIDRLAGMERARPSRLPSLLQSMGYSGTHRNGVRRE